MPESVEATEIGRNRTGVQTSPKLSEQMNEVEDLIAALHRHAPGDTIAVEIERNNQTQTLQVTLGDHP